MKYMELIVLSDFQDDKRRYEDALKSINFEFKSTEYTIILRIDFLPGSQGTLPHILALFERMGLQTRGKRKYYTAYSQEDYSSADLFFPNFSGGVSCECDYFSRCPSCGKFSKKLDYDKSGADLTRSYWPVYSVDEVDFIVKTELKQAILAEGLTGIKFLPFDPNERYFLVSSDVELGDHIFRENETLNFKGYCPECAAPLFEMYYGPYRYGKGNYNGEDFAKIRFPFEEIICSQKACNFLKRYDKELEIILPVFLE